MFSVLNNFEDQIVFNDGFLSFINILLFPYKSKPNRFFTKPNKRT